KLEPLVAPYVDGELDAMRRNEVDAHLQECPPCHERVAAERAIRDLLQDRRTSLSRICAPAGLRTRCAALWSRDPGAPQQEHRRPLRARWRMPVRSLAMAAALVLAVGGTVVYEVTDKSDHVMAAELVSDHLKCFGVINHLLQTSDDPAA